MLFWCFLFAYIANAFFAAVKAQKDAPPPEEIPLTEGAEGAAAAEGAAPAEEAPVAAAA